MGSTAGQSLVILQFLIDAGWVLLPLAPAILIYWIFPATPANVQGPLGALKINAGGAFAAYLIVFLATMPLITRLNRNLEGQLHPAWTIKGQILPQDENGRPIALQSMDGDPVHISFEPNGLQLRKDLSFEATVPEINGSVPAVNVNFAGVGTSYMNFERLGPGDDVDKNYDDRVITIRSPILIRRQSCIGIDCSSQQ